MQAPHAISLFSFSFFFPFPIFKVLNRKIGYLRAISLGGLWVILIACHAYSPSTTRGLSPTTVKQKRFEGVLHNTLPHSNSRAFETNHSISLLFLLFHSHGVGVKHLHSPIDSVYSIYNNWFNPSSLHQRRLEQIHVVVMVVAIRKEKNKIEEKRKKKERIVCHF